MRFPKDFTIQTARLILRTPSLEDIPAIFAASQVDGFCDGMLWEPPASEAELVAPYHANANAWEQDNAYCFSMIHKDNGEFIGRVSIRKQEKTGVWDVGFFTHPNHQGNGYMTEALHATMKFGFEALGVEHLIADHATWNSASESVLKKNGMIFIKHIPKGFFKQGQWTEENRLGISKAEWIHLNAKTSE